MRHALAVVLTLTACAVLTGATPRAPGCADCPWTASPCAARRRPRGGGSDRRSPGRASSRSAWASERHVHRQDLGGYTTTLGES
ncbi:hypothetical protein [Streptomyces sp. NPDC057748]|uniref:hypothetical protein n=1 Tax=Streptomyces sp. NPDC057748 TaxID=3346239 RepID=UPI0036AA090A